MDDKRRFGSAAIEAANRAEATALLIRCNYRVYRPEADIEGEDLLVREPREGAYHGVQLKSGAVVDKKYLGKRLLLLFPSKLHADPETRWFLIPHDHLFAWIKQRHGHTPKWSERWVYTRATKSLLDFVSEHEVIRPPHDDRFLATEEGAEFTDENGDPIDIAARINSN